MLLAPGKFAVDKSEPASRPRSAEATHVPHQPLLSHFASENDENAPMNSSAQPVPPYGRQPRMLGNGAAQPDASDPPAPDFCPSATSQSHDMQPKQQLKGLPSAGPAVPQSASTPDDTPRAFLDERPPNALPVRPSGSRIPTPFTQAGVFTSPVKTKPPPEQRFLPPGPQLVDTAGPAAAQQGSGQAQDAAGAPLAGDGIAIMAAANAPAEANGMLQPGAGADADALQPALEDMRSGRTSARCLFVRFLVLRHNCSYQRFSGSCCPAQAICGGYHQMPLSGLL